MPKTEVYREGRGGGKYVVKRRKTLTSAEAEASKKRSEEQETSLGAIAKKHKEARGEEVGEATPTSTPKETKSATDQLKGLVDPIPKSKDYPSLGAFAKAMKEWRARQKK